jgi:hypothetical protein
MTKTSGKAEVSAWLLTNAIILPFGDHAGSVYEGATSACAPDAIAATSTTKAAAVSVALRPDVCGSSLLVFTAAIWQKCTSADRFRRY